MTLPPRPLPPRPLPPRLCLAPHRTVLPRGARRRQLGLDPDTALVVDDLEPALARLVDELAVPTDTDVLLARAGGRGADTGAARDLLTALADAGAVVDA
ncbi:MAG: hypothetical protein NTW05_09805, partial [Pseudonocardiales bacterium]|nr:hypothetical protein [Pseudonocardiales bacterium]